jgi:hypothetical protein
MRTSWITVVVGILAVQCALAMLNAQPLSSKGNPPLAVSLCNVLEHPDAFSGKIIRFRGNLDTDGFEYTTIFDAQCNQGVSPWTSKKSNRRSDVRAFNRALDAQRPGAPHDEISAEFVGRFEYDPQASPTRRRLFEILAVQNLVISKEGPPRVVNPAVDTAGSSSTHESGHEDSPVRH